MGVFVEFPVTSVPHFGSGIKENWDNQLHLRACGDTNQKGR